MCAIMEEMKNEARDEGIKAGIEVGMKEGIKEGMKETRASMVVDMYKQGIPMETIVNVAHISILAINKILKKAGVEVKA